MGIPTAFSLAQVVSTLFIATNAREFFHFKLEWNEQVKGMVKQIFYLFIFYGIYPIYMLADNIFASSLPTKFISALNYGILIAYLPAAILRFSKISVTSLSENKAALNKLEQYFLFLIVFSLPIIIGCWLFIVPVLKFFLAYGRLTMLDVRLISKAVRYYILGLPFFLCWPVMYNAYLVKNRLPSLILIVIVGLFINIFLKFYFVFHLKLAIIGITFPTLIAYAFICVAAFVLLKTSEK